MVVLVCPYRMVWLSEPDSDPQRELLTLYLTVIAVPTAGVGSLGFSVVTAGVVTVTFVVVTVVVVTVVVVAAGEVEDGEVDVGVVTDGFVVVVGVGSVCGVETVVEGLVGFAV